MQRRSFLKLIGLSVVGTSLLPCVNFGKEKTDKISTLEKINYKLLVTKLKRDIETICEQFTFEPIDDKTTEQLRVALVRMLDVNYLLPGLIYQSNVNTFPNIKNGVMVMHANIGVQFRSTIEWTVFNCILLSET